LRPSPARIQPLLAKGASLIADGVEALTPEIATLSTALSRHFAGLVGANIYCSFGGVQAFNTHFDLHHVFAVQVEGEKTWRLYQNRADQPIDFPADGPDARQWFARTRGPLMHEVLMRPGDVLYLPRGWYHDALTPSGSSLHVTFSVTPLYGRIMFGLLEAAADAVAGSIGDGPIHQRLGAAWNLDASGADLVRRALVLLADHELNASTFAVRVAASTGSSLAAASLAGLAALSGPLHGGMAARVEMFVDEAQRRGAAKAVAERLAQGSATPGFGHPLYPDGDPRAAALLDAFKVPALLADLRRETEAATGQAPNIDFALVAMARTLALPADAPFSLFAVGRMAGWHAHAIEQLQTGKLIRPRARYVGVRPAT